jgi:DNA-binding NtrC family response regulator
MTLDNRALRRELSDGGHLMKKLIGKSSPMQRLREDILDISQSDGHVLIDGETGTGKTLVAHALHAVGSRAGKKFVLLSCSAYEEEALSRRLFGPVFAEDNFLPALEEARGGTLVLEDIETLPEPVQRKLLSAINDQGTPAETRIFAICNSAEAGKVAADKLRSDLYYRLNSLRITVPPLRKRGDDILEMFNRLCDGYADDYGCDSPTISAQDAAQLLQAPWPGNVRQLANVVEQMVVLTENDYLSSGDVPTELADWRSKEDLLELGTADFKKARALFERRFLCEALERHNGVIAQVAEAIGMSRKNLYLKLDSLGIEYDNYRRCG